MNRTDVLKLISARRPDLARFGVRSLALFGSIARDEGHPGSDVDVLVEFDGKATFDGYINLKLFLEELLKCKVDLVTRNGLRPRIRPYIEKEAVYVA
ncbi:MAG TPA: nucleotidyltransferase family protein [Pyrinomonadaceae bacterium]|nr:nucleotidyltransferase family protein [Pyrinomonadaceae bacterium]